MASIMSCVADAASAICGASSAGYTRAENKESSPKSVVADAGAPTLDFGDNSTAAATETGSEPSTQPSSPSGGRLSLLSCPLQDALAFYLGTAELGKLSCGCQMLRSELTVETEGESKRRLLCPVVELKVETAEAELERVSLPHITILRIFNRLPLDALGAAAARTGRESLRCVEKFVCKGCPLDAYDVKKVLAPILARTRGIKLLNLEKNRITDATVQALCDSGLLSRVENLNLRFNEITDKGAIALANCKDARTLNWINLKMNRVTDTGALALASMVAESSTMTLLNLRRQVPGLTDKAAYGFAEMLQQNRSLEKLRLRRNRITDKGATALAQATTERMSRLCKEVPPYEEVFFELDLEQNRVKDEGAMALAQTATEVPQRAKLQLLLFGNTVTRDSLRTAVADTGVAVDASSTRLWFDSKPEYDL